MKKLLSLVICSLVICASVCPIFALSISHGEDTVVGNMERVTDSVPFDFEVVSVGHDSVEAAFIATGRIDSPPYVGIKGTKNVAEKTSELRYVLEYDTEYSFVYTVTEGNVKTVYNSFISVETEGTPTVVFGDVIKNIVDPNSTRGAGQITETEPNDTPETADITFDDFDNYGTMTVYNDPSNPSVDLPGDTDYWKVTFNQSGSANFWLGNIPSGCDYDIILFNDAGQQIGYSSNYGQTDELIQEDVEANKTYYIAITSYGSVVSSSQYLFRTKNYPTIAELSILSIRKKIPETTSLLPTGVVSNGQIVCKIEIDYVYPISSATPVTFTFQNFNTPTTKLVSNPSVVVTPTEGCAIATATYHVFTGTNFAPSASVAVNGSTVASINQSISLDISSPIPYEGQFRLSYYITALEWDPEYQSGVTETIQALDSSTNTVIELTLDKKFLDEVDTQGSGRLNDGRIIQGGWQYYYNIYPYTHIICGAGGTPVVPYETCAVNQSRIIMEANYNRFSQLQIDGVNNLLIANDIGGAITEYRIDVYIGEKLVSEYLANEPSWNWKYKDVALSGILGYSGSTNTYSPN